MRGRSTLLVLLCLLAWPIATAASDRLVIYPYEATLSVVAGTETYAVKVTYSRPFKCSGMPRVKITYPPSLYSNLAGTVTPPTDVSLGWTADWLCAPRYLPIVEYNPGFSDMFFVEITVPARQSKKPVLGTLTASLYYQCWEYYDPSYYYNWGWRRDGYAAAAAGDVPLSFRKTFTASTSGEISYSCPG